jgi:ribosomal protein L11 methyltransferase
MARSLNQSTTPKVLHEIALTGPLEAEPILSAFLEHHLGIVPSSYDDLENQTTRVSVYLEEFQSNGAAFFDHLQGLLRQLEKDTGFPFSFEQNKLPQENWAESWKKHFRPISIAGKLLVKPSWSKTTPRVGQKVVVLDPGLSFGTGHHATTSYCLKQLVRFKALRPAVSFLDIGTGSGILAIAAAQLGFKPVEGFDYDPEAVRVSRENAVVNKLKLKFYQADLTQLPEKTKKRFDLVCANLIFDLLIQQARKIGNRVKPDGALVLAGILRTQFDRVAAAYAVEGWALKNSREEKEWKSGLFLRSPQG